MTKCHVNCAMQQDAAGCRSQKLLQDWSSFVPGKALDFSKTVSDCHRIKSCIAANKECGIKTLRVTLPVFYPASLGPRVWRQVRAQHWSNPQISCSEEALQKIWEREDLQFVHVYKVYWYILNHDWSWKCRKVWKMSHDVFCLVFQTKLSHLLPQPHGYM